MTARALVAAKQANANWRLELLGGATLIGASGARVTLERKTAGLLALLAVEGELGRSKAAGLLWPDVSEARARANLRQCLHRLKKALGSKADTDHSLQIVLIGERLSLAAQLEVDTVTLESRAFVGDDAGLIAVRGQLLEQIDFDDCPEFAEWLTSQRTHWRDARAAAFNRALRDPAISSAVEWAHEWVALEPLSEEAQRALARAFAVRGNRALALQTLRDFAVLLRVELNASPSIETCTLLESLERDQPMPLSVAPRVPRALPSPPRLIGRGREWALLERAWADGVDIVVRGAPGVGKTRLIADFLSSKTRFDWLEARPGDAGVPMAVYARALNSLPQGFALELPEWVVTELSRLLPELSQIAPPSMTEAADKLRFFEALLQVSLRRLEQGITALAIDDLQFMDAASFEALQFNRAHAQQRGIRTLSAYRSGELSAELESQLEQLAISGRLQIIDLEPLDSSAMGELVTHLHPDALPALIAELFERTGGNPLYALETMRDLEEQRASQFDSVRGSVSPALRVTPLVQRITAQRLERRSVEAQRIAQVAAVAGVEFSLELAAFALGCAALELALPLRELEDAELLRGERFGHDLLLEAVLAGIPESIKRFLHRQCALFLKDQTDLARIADHWASGGDLAQAVPLWSAAALKAISQLQPRQAARLLELAAQGLETLGLRSQAFETWLELHKVYTHFENGSQHDALVERLLNSASSVQQHLKAWVICATLHLMRGQLEPAADAISQARAQAVASGDERLEIEPLNLLGIVQRRQGQLKAALESLERSRELCERFNENEPLAAVLSNLGLVLQRLERRSEAAQAFQAAARLQRDPITRARVLNNAAMLLVSQGRMREALNTLEETRDLLEDSTSASNAQLVVYTSLGNVMRSIGNYVASLEYLQRAAALTGGDQHYKAEDLQRNFARTLMVLGRGDLAQMHLNHAFQLSASNPSESGLSWLQQGRLDTLVGRDASQALLMAERLLRVEEHTVALQQVDLERALLEPLNAKASLEGVLKYAIAGELHGLEIAARARLAAACRAAGQALEALGHTTRGLALIAQFESDFYRGELLLEHHRCLLQTNHPDAKPFLERTLSWLTQTAHQRVPPEYRQSFLQGNPINRALLVAAHAASLETPAFF